MTALMYSKNIKHPLIKRGKVRDVYATGSENHLAIVACDRISAFDCVLPTPIPGKGIMLTRLSNFWFRKTSGIIANHLVEPDAESMDWYAGELKERTVYVKKTEPLPIEAIVRGYLTGSGLRDYQQTGMVCGIRLEKGLKESSRLPEPIYTPSTKAAAGEHDKNINFAKTASLVGEELAREVRDTSLKLYSYAAEYALSRGIILADTKFEFGLADGELILIDELFTPDSSRFWPADGYVPGKGQPSFDKQFVRDYLESIGWNKKPPAPELPVELVARTGDKYREAMELLTA